MKKSKPKKLSWYKKRAWDAFSLWVRRRNEINGVVSCVTCGKSGHYKEFHAGHFVDSRNNTVLFDEKLVHPQCPKCNLWLNGNKIKYVLFMKRNYGFTDEQLEEMDNLKFHVKPMTRTDYQEIEQLYKARVGEFK